MSQDFYTSEVFKQLMEAIQAKYGTITSYTVCHSFESPEYLEYLATVKEEGEDEIIDTSKKDYPEPL